MLFRSVKMNKIYKWALIESLKKMNPKSQIKNPVMFVVYIGAILSTILIFTDSSVPKWFTISVTILLWLTLLFANFAESIAEGRGKAQADSLKQAKKEVIAYKVSSIETALEGKYVEIKSTELRRNDLI